MTPNLIRHPLTVVRLVYITGFFALLSGIFYPVVTQTSLADSIRGILILFLGLFGGFVIYRAAFSKKSTTPLLGAGLAILMLTLYLVMDFSGVI